MRDLTKMGKAFDSLSLTLEHLSPSPFLQFEAWFNEAVAFPIAEPNAMALSTCDNQNQPNARMVLLKQFDETGMVFFSNYESQKAQELSTNPKASLLFWWSPLNRQVRLQGVIHKTDPKNSADYFHSRPLESQIAAIISPQSKKITDKSVLMQKHQTLLSQHQQAGTLPDCPDYWGGFKFVPHRFEFWQGNAHRLSDRFAYDYDSNTLNWVITQLAP